MNPYNPTFYGFTENKNLIPDSAPYFYKYLGHDNKTCIASKSIFNNIHSSVYSPDSIVRSHPASSLIQSSVLNKAEKDIFKNCTPSFKYDSAVPSNVNYGTVNFGNNNYGSNNYS